MQQHLKILYFILSCALLFIMPIENLWASNIIKKLAMFDNWEVVSFYDKNIKSCAVNNSSQLDPSTEQEETTKIVLFITNWPSRKEYLALSARSFAVLQPDKMAWMIFPDNTRFPLKQGELEAKPDPAQRANIISAMQKNDKMEIVMYGKDGQEIKRSFQLKSLNPALATLNRFCPLP